MKVYFVSIDYGYDGGLVPLGIFSTYEKADYARQSFGKSSEPIDIWELEVDSKPDFSYFNTAKRM